MKGLPRTNVVVVFELPHPYFLLSHSSSEEFQLLNSTWCTVESNLIHELWIWAYITYRVTSFFFKVISSYKFKNLIIFFFSLEVKQWAGFMKFLILKTCMVCIIYIVFSLSIWPNIFGSGDDPACKNMINFGSLSRLFLQSKPWVCAEVNNY